MFCFPTVGRETQRKSGCKPNGENQPDRRDGHFQHVCSPPTIIKHHLLSARWCWSSNNPRIPGSTRIHSLGTGVSLVREWYPLAAPRAALVQALAAPHGPSQRNKSTGKGKGNSEFPFETSFASWQLCEVAVTFQERKLFQYIPSCSNFPLLISSLVSMIKPHFR